MCVCKAFGRICTYGLPKWAFMSVCVRKWHQNLASKFGLTPHPRGPHTKKILYTQINISDSRLLHFYPAHFFYLSLPNPSVSIHLSLYISICLKRFLFSHNLHLYLFIYPPLSITIFGFCVFCKPGRGAAGRGGGQGRRAGLFKSKDFYHT